MTTPSERAGLKEAAEKAGADQWSVDPDDREGMEWNRHVLDQRGHRVCFMAHSGGKNPDRDEARATFIALASPAAILALLAERDALTGEVERLKGEAGRALLKDQSHG